jgi:hypothetical protein
MSSSLPSLSAGEAFCIAVVSTVNLAQDSVYASLVCTGAIPAAASTAVDVSMPIGRAVKSLLLGIIWASLVLLLGRGIQARAEEKLTDVVAAAMISVQRLNTAARDGFLAGIFLSSQAAGSMGPAVLH